DRLQLRQDNADLRLTARGFKAGLVGRTRWERFQKKIQSLYELRAAAATTVHQGIHLTRLLKRPEIEWPHLPAEITNLAAPEIWDLFATDVKYEGYVAKQVEHNRTLARRDQQKIPDGFDFTQVNGLRSETRQKLNAI